MNEKVWKKSKWSCLKKIKKGWHEARWKNRDMRNDPLKKMMMKKRWSEIDAIVRITWESSYEKKKDYSERKRNEKIFKRIWNLKSMREKMQLKELLFRSEPSKELYYCAPELDWTKLSKCLTSRGLNTSFLWEEHVDDDGENEEKVEGTDV